MSSPGARGSSEGWEEPAPVDRRCPRGDPTSQGWPAWGRRPARGARIVFSALEMGVCGGSGKSLRPAARDDAAAGGGGKAGAAGRVTSWTPQPALIAPPARLRLCPSARNVYCTPTHLVGIRAARGGTSVDRGPRSPRGLTAATDREGRRPSPWPAPHAPLPLASDHANPPTRLGRGSADPMDKSSLSERDICTKFITPAVRQAGWDEMPQIREEVCFTKGRIIVRGKLVTRGKAKRADYVLYYKPNIPIAVIEAKDNTHSVGDGMQQALDYAETLDVPFVFVVQRRRLRLPRPHRHERRAARPTLALDAFPSPGRPVGALPHLEGPDPGRPRRSSCRTTSTTAAARSRATTSSTPSTPPIEAIAKGQDRSCSSWPPAPARPTPPSRSSGGLWKAGRRSASCSWPTATS